AHEPVSAECQAVRTAVGLMEISTYAKYKVSGAGAEAWLSHLLAARMPEQGRLALTPLLNPNRKLIGDFTVARASSERFYIFGSGMAGDYHMRWFESQLPDHGVAIRPLRSELVGLSIAGPRSRELLQRLTPQDVSTAAFPFLSFSEMELGMLPAKVG